MKKYIALFLIVVSLSRAYYIYNRHGAQCRDDSSSIDQQMVHFLQEYIRINTTHPTPDYESALTFLKKHAHQDGFAYQEVALPSGKKVLIITLQGSDPSLQPLALNHHMDVVPALDAEQWITPPFAGQLYQNHIVGRGAQDMKGIAALHYYALKEFKQTYGQPRRTVHLFAVPDEEIGGFTGTQEFVKTDTFKKLNIGYVIDEGHASGNRHILDIKVAERKPIQIEVTSYGALAHGSHLQADNAIHTLITFLQELITIHRAQQQLIGTKQPGELLSCNITSLTAGIKKENGHIALNMVPDCARATVDIRVPPGCACSEIITILENLIKGYPTLEYTILARAHEEPKIDNYETRLYKKLAQSIKEYGLDTRPHFFEASSDLRFYQALGIEGVGLTPFTIEDNIHGTNESVPVPQLIRGKEIFVQFLKDFCSP